MAGACRADDPGGISTCPTRRSLYTAQVQAQEEMYPQLIAKLRELAGGGMTVMPSSIADFCWMRIPRV